MMVIATGIIPLSPQFIICFKDGYVEKQPSSG